MNIKPTKFTHGFNIIFTLTRGNFYVFDILAYDPIYGDGAQGAEMIKECWGFAWFSDMPFDYVAWRKY